jgi:hypothetical protein
VPGDRRLPLILLSIYYRDFVASSPQAILRKVESRFREKPCSQHIARIRNKSIPRFPFNTREFPEFPPEAPDVINAPFMEAFECLVAISVALIHCLHEVVKETLLSELNGRLPNDIGFCSIDKLVRKYIQSMHLLCSIVVTEKITIA